MITDVRQPEASAFPRGQGARMAIGVVPSNRFAVVTALCRASDQQPMPVRDHSGDHPNPSHTTKGDTADLKS